MDKHIYKIRNGTKLLMLLGLMLIHGLFSFTQAQTLPNASFATSATSGCAPLSIQFYNNSNNATSYYWDFGNGNTSTSPTPSNVYLNNGNYTVTLIAYNANTSDTLKMQNIINVIPKPTASFTVNNTVACVNSNSFQFHNNSTLANSYLWDFGDGDTSSLHNPQHTYTLSGIYSVKLIATNSTGCQDIFIRSQYITINTKPQAEFSVNSQFACSPGTPFQFNTTAPTTWVRNWNFGDGNTSTANNPAHTYIASGTYDVRLVLTNNQGCKDTLIKPSHLTIANTAQPVFSVINTSGCAPFTANFSGPTGMTSYTWDFGDSTSSTDQNPVKVYSNSGVYTVTLTSTNTQGCSSQHTSINLIQVYPKPQASFSLANGTGCAPLAVSFTNTSLNATSYLWDFGDGTTSTLTNPTHIYTTNRSYLVYLTAYDNNGCSDNKMAGTYIHVHSPSAQFTATSTMGCSPFTTQFNTTYPGIVSWQWDFGDGTTSSIQNPLKTYSYTGDFDVSLIVTNIWGCIDTVRKTSFINVVNPYANYTPPPITIGCVPYTANLSDQTAGRISWLWNFGDGTTSNLQNPTHVYNTPGTYTVSLSTSTVNGCIQTVPNFKTFEVKGAIAHFGVTSNACPPYIATFRDSSANAVSWFWNFGDGTYSNQQHPVHTFPGYGSYNVSLTITTADGCAHTSMQTNAVNFTPLSAQFSYATADTTYPATVQFMANSIGANDWWWEFGDGGTSWLENPSHTFLVAGNYTVSLWISNGECSMTYTLPNFQLGSGLDSSAVIAISGPAHIPQTGCAPFQVQFFDTTMAGVSWLWEFGDGTSSSLQDPSHTYLYAGVYSPRLIVTNALGLVDTVNAPGSIIVSGTQANFSITTQNNCQGTSVTLNDLSTGAYFWNWDFGDGNFSTLQNPTHVYPNLNSNYVVQLMVRDTIGCSSFNSRYIFAGLNNPTFISTDEVCVGDTVSFNNSLSNYTSYLWNFGDGNSSSLHSPTHTYSNIGTYYVSLTTTDSTGCSQVFNLPVGVKVIQPESIFIVYGANSGCGSLSANFLNHSKNADTYLWDFGDGTFANTAHATHVYNTPGTYTVTLTAFRKGCSSVYTINNAVTISAPLADFSMNVQGTCLPMLINFIDQSAYAHSWQWNFGDGTTSTLQNPGHVYTSTPTSNIILTINDGNGCTSTKVLAAPGVTKAGFTVLSAAGCNPFTASFQDTSTNAISWLWDFGDGTTSTLQNPIHTYLQAGNYSVSLIVGSQSGCFDSIQTQSLINVNAPHANFSANTTAACAPSLITFTDQSIDAVAWLWDFGDATFSSSQNPSKIYSTPGIYDIKLVVSNINGCTDTLIRLAFVTINGPVTLFTSSTQNSCAPASIQFTDLSINAYSWSWNFGNGIASNLQNPMIAYLDTGSYVVSLITSDSLGCESLFTLALPIEIYPTPVANFSSSASVGCAPFIVSFTNTSIYGDNYIWDFGDGSISYQPSPSHVYTQAGNYTITLIAISQYGCSDTLVSNVNIQVGLQPVAAFTSNGNTGCAPYQMNFSNTTQNTGSFTIYFWDFGNGQTSTLANPSVLYNQAGIYSITLIVSNPGGCSDTLFMQNYLQIFDDKAPKNSEIFTVDVISDTQIGVHYSYVTDLDLAEYRLYRRDNTNSNYQLIYTQTNPGNTSFSIDTLIVDASLDTKNKIYSYKIQTIDLCGNTIDLSNLKEYSSINLSATTVSNGVRLNWNLYGGCIASSYDVQRASLGSSAYTTIATLDSNSTIYIDSEQTCPQIFTYRILAKDLCGRPFTARSDTAAAFLPGNTDELKADIIRTTVIDDRSTYTEWTAPASGISNVKAYMVYRSVDFNNYQLVASLPAQATEFVDINTDVHASKYMYTVSVVNNCDYEGNKGKIGSTVLLKAAMNNGVPVLTWNTYLGWDSGVEQYKIERQNADGTWSVVGKTDGNTNMFIDR